MDFDRERELEDAGIDAFEFSLMLHARKQSMSDSTALLKSFRTDRLWQERCMICFLKMRRKQ